MIDSADTEYVMFGMHCSLGVVNQITMNFTSFSVPFCCCQIDCLDKLLLAITMFDMTTIKRHSLFDDIMNGSGTCMLTIQYCYDTVAIKQIRLLHLVIQLCSKII